MRTRTLKVHERTGNNQSNVGAEERPSEQTRFLKILKYYLEQTGQPGLKKNNMRERTGSKYYKRNISRLQRTRFIVP